MTPVHSNAEPLVDGRLSAPAAVRNGPAIIAALADWLPEAGKVLEIAAGTGQHAVALAQAYPDLTWLPTDIEPERLSSIDAWRAAEQVTNMRVATWLDASAPDWAIEPVDAVYVANLMHLLPKAAAKHVIKGVARALNPGGRFLLYGPFRTGGSFRSTGDESFDASLRESDPKIGYKDLEWIEKRAKKAGMMLRATIEVPANNLVVVFEKS